MNPLAAIPRNVRIGLYLAYAVVGPVLIYTAARGWTGDAEYALYVGLGAALGVTAASNATEPTTVAVQAPEDATITATVDYTGEHEAEGI